jgi:hypothetical protein
MDEIAALNASRTKSQEAAVEVPSQFSSLSSKTDATADGDNDRAMSGDQTVAAAGDVAMTRERVASPAAAMDEIAALNASRTKSQEAAVEAARLRREAKKKAKTETAAVLNDSAVSSSLSVFSSDAGVDDTRVDDSSPVLLPTLRPTTAETQSAFSAGVQNNRHTGYASSLSPNSASSATVSTSSPASIGTRVRTKPTLFLNFIWKMRSRIRHSLYLYFPNPEILRVQCRIL